MSWEIKGIEETCFLTNITGFFCVTTAEAYAPTLLVWQKKKKILAEIRVY